MTRLMPSVYARRELRAVVVSVKALPREVRRAISQGTRDTMNPVWRNLVTSKARTPLEKAALAKGARIAAGNPPKAIAASSVRPLAGGLRPANAAAVLEAGSKRRDQRGTWPRRSPEGGSHLVHGWPNRQLVVYRRGGYVVFPAFRELGPRLTQLWVQTVMRKTYDALERR
ncbi:hypothetical protein ACFWH7_19600 [Cellulosimicrobium cellulans]|uniref:hypothetical protein n=2 Tax=Cellulosimicrobium cellulans TaxID=1710 RepID=UPI00365D2D7A